MTRHFRDALTSKELAASVTANVRSALAEDLGLTDAQLDDPGAIQAADVTACLVPADELVKAKVITREPGIMCGRLWADKTRDLVDPTLQFTWHVEDGQRLAPNDTLFEVQGLARSILTAERTMLNFIQLLSGTATQADYYSSLVGGSNARVLDTRKTIPGLRLAQKYAITCGGGFNHRMGLYDAFLIKENHITAAGSIAAAVANAHAAHPDLPLEVEVERIEQMHEAIDAGADIVMLDNFDLKRTRAAVLANNGSVKLEASGNVDEKTITDIAATGVDYISSGNLTKKLVPLDLSMRFID